METLATAPNTLAKRLTVLAFWTKFLVTPLPDVDEPLVGEILRAGWAFNPAGLFFPQWVAHFESGSLVADRTNIEACFEAWKLGCQFEEYVDYTTADDQERKARVSCKGQAARAFSKLVELASRLSEG